MRALKKKLLWAVGVMIVVAALAAGGYYLLAGSHSVVTYNPGDQAGAAAPAVPSTQRTPPPGYKEYRNGAYHISLFYPQDLAVKEHSGAAGTMTVTFQSADTKNPQGFQIFAEPYLEPQITQAQFKKDEPSGVMNDPLNVTIDGAAATSFYSTDISLGETAEIWFIRNQFLYEVTTLKPLAPWLGHIMQSWRFI